MEKYQNIRDLITRGEFRPALERLEEILEKEPEDLEAQQLHYTCSEVLRIQNTGVGADDEESEMESDEVSVREYLTAHFRHPARKVCRFIFLALSRVPEKWRKKLKADRFRVWEIALTVNADAVKTSAGALHTLPVCREKNITETLKYLKASGVRIVCATEKGKINYTQTCFTEPVCVVMGAEDTGIPHEHLALCDDWVSIPQFGNIESLNVSVATGVILYEAVRQRQLLE